MIEIKHRTHTCGELTGKNINEEVVLEGWVNSRRDHGGLIFIDLRDRYGMTQVVFDPEVSKELHSQAHLLRPEFVILVKGKVKPRPDGTVNTKMKTGEIEVLADGIHIYNESKTPPFEIRDKNVASEELRLKYRYLDLRREEMQSNFIIRNKAYIAVREFLNKQNFIEVETPMLLKSTPEGARDYLVPSRVSPGEFYALPQSPQMLKQLLMVSGFDKYFQIARCFRDEDLRADRQPEFSQIDIEMSFVEEDDVMTLTEGLMKEIFKKTIDVDIEIPFKRLDYEDAMDDYGFDKPDNRGDRINPKIDKGFEYFISSMYDMSDIFRNTEFNIFNECLKNNGKIYGLFVYPLNFTRSMIGQFEAKAREYKAKGLIHVKYGDNGIESPIKKYITQEIEKKLVETSKKWAEAKSWNLFIIADKIDIVRESLGNVRLEIIRASNLKNKDRYPKYSFLWVKNFPMFELDSEEKRLVAKHHPFTSPKPEDIGLLESSPLKVKARAYDLVLNGVELGGGSIRNSNREVQEKVFKAIGMSQEEAKERFGFLLEALDYGAPPHGGIALGFDRICMMLSGASSIRDVIAFPKTLNAQCLLTGAPSRVSEKQLKELHLKIEK